MRLITRLISLFVGLGTLLPGSLALAAVKPEEALRQLRSMRSANQARLEQIDSKISSLLVGRAGAPGMSLLLPLPQVEGEVESLQRRRRESLARQQVLDRLILQFDGKFRGENLREFLHERLLNMAQVEAMPAPGSTGGGSANLWRFFTYLAVAVKDVPEREEHLLSVIEGYMNFGSVFDPPRPEAFLSSRQYTNGRESLAAAPVSKEDVGELVEKQLEHESASRPASPPNPIAPSSGPESAPSLN